MIKIIKGDEERVIPAGAFKMFASAGWQKAENSESHDDTDKNTKSTIQEPGLGEISKSGTEPDGTEDPDKGNPEDKGDGTGDINGDDPDDPDVVYVDPEELLEKPVGDLDFEELQIVAEYLGLDVENLTTLKALRKAIKEAQN